MCHGVCASDATGLACGASDVTGLACVRCRKFSLIEKCFIVIHSKAIWFQLGLGGIQILIPSNLLPILPRYTVLP